MKASEFRGLPDDELLKKELELREEIFNLKFQLATQKNTNFARIGSLKKDLARVLTIMLERKESLTEDAVKGEANNE